MDGIELTVQDAPATPVGQVRFEVDEDEPEDHHVALLRFREETTARLKRERTRAAVIGLVGAVLIAAGVVGALTSGTGGRGEIVILVSCDGFRADYLDSPGHEDDWPNIRWVTEGVHVRGMEPVFPSKTFPNHYSLATGLVPSSHGIVANSFYDPAFDATFRLSYTEEMARARWWLGEPIWVTAIKHGLRSATMFWPGSSAPIGGKHPTYWLPYRKSMTADERVDKVLEWLSLPVSKRPQVVLVYLENIDGAGHEYGPHSPQVFQAMEVVDRAIGRLRLGLQQRGLLDATNIIVTADHGMAATSSDRVNIIDDYIDSTVVDLYQHTRPALVVDQGVLLQLWPRTPQEESYLYSALSNVPNFALYHSSDIPERWRYRGSDRISPLFGVSQIDAHGQAWLTMTKRLYDSSMAGRGIIPGNHGYDNAQREMRAFFAARGPSFRSNASVESLHNIDVYETMCLVLGIPAAPNNGTITRALPLLRDQEDRS